MYMWFFSSLFKKDPYENPDFKLFMEQLPEIFYVTDEHIRILENMERERTRSGIEYFFSTMRATLTPKEDEVVENENETKSELDTYESQWYSRVKILWSWCDHCMDKMNTSISISEARKMIGKPISDKCECPYFFRPDVESKQY